jgi:glycosyltransferase involved in cell wall biosynthesis
MNQKRQVEKVGPGEEMPEISVVLPVFNEDEGIRILIPSIVNALHQLELQFEIIAVDDGSQDQTLDVLLELRKDFPRRLRVAHHLVNRGNGASLRTGIGLARGKLIVTMDADGQHDPEDIQTLLHEIPPYDLVIGARTSIYRGHWYRGLANSFYNRFASWLTRAEIQDLTSGFRAMRRTAVLHFLPLFPDGFSAPTTTTMAFLKAGYNVKFIPIDVKQRKSGKSKIHLWRDGVRFIMIILRMIMLYDPLRIFLPLGLLSFLLGIAAWVAGIVFAARLVFPNSAIFLFSTALTTWLLGLIASQISSNQIHSYGDESVEIYQVDGISRE